MLKDLATVCTLLLVGSEARAESLSTTAPSDVVSAFAPQQQGPQLGWGMSQGQSGSPPRGGTPEPGLLLLMSGGALAYGALRRRGKRSGKLPEA